MSILYKLNCRVNLIPIKIPAGPYVERLILQFMYKFKEPRIPTTIFKKNKIEGLILSHFIKLYKSALMVLVKDA